MLTGFNNYGHYGRLFMCIYKVRLLIIHLFIINDLLLHNYLIYHK